MKTSTMIYAFRLSATAVFLAACGGPQPPIGAPSAMQKAHAVTRTTRPQTNGYQVLYSFNRVDGAHPYSDVLGHGGNLFGTASKAGRLHNGTIYEVGLDGKERVLHRFAGGSDGSHPTAGLTELHGTLYGTTPHGGTGSCSYGGCGIIFSISPSGKNYTIVHEFDGADGAFPSSDFVVFEGALYGATSGGGANDHGTIFTVSPSGGFKTLYSFKAKPDGNSPMGRLAGLNGKLYGATLGGGANDDGTVFSVTPGGAEQVVYSCGEDDCWGPMGGVVLLRGKLYGTSYYAGSNGSVFSVTTGGKEHTVYSFGGHENGEYPVAPLTVHNDVLYGTTQDGGFNDCGTLFSLTPSGSLKVLYKWSGGDGCNPSAAVTYLNGNLYGTFPSGGVHNKGLLFSLAPPL